MRRLIGTIVVAVLVAGCGGKHGAPTVTVAQADAAEKHFDAVDDLAHRTGNAAGLAAIETCTAAQTDSARTAADNAIGAIGAVADPAHTSTRDAVEIPVANGFPQQFLYVEHYVVPSAHFDALSLNVFTRASATAPWKLCDYPNLFTGQRLPTFATSATDILRATVNKGLQAKADHALGLLATWMTQRSTAEVSPPTGLIVPIGECGASDPQCNPDGTFDPYNPSAVGGTEPLVVTRSTDPVFLYPTTDGGALVIADLTMVEHHVRGVSPLVQDAKRTQFATVVPPGSYSAVQVHDVFQVALEVAADGSAKEVGETWDAASATETPATQVSPLASVTNA
jgi:hypothetical protein